MKRFTFIYSSEKTDWTWRTVTCEAESTEEVENTFNLNDGRTNYEYKKIETI